jgi:hypothetical protein
MREWLVMDENETRRWIIFRFVIGHRFVFFRDTPRLALEVWMTWMN